MDQSIFEEFKGTSNSELVIERSLAEGRIFPAIDISASGTRKEAKLYNERHTRGLATFRHVLSGYGTGEAIEFPASCWLSTPSTPISSRVCGTAANCCG